MSSLDRSRRLQEINAELAAAVERMLDAEDDPATMAAVLAESRRLREEKNRLLAAGDAGAGAEAAPAVPEQQRQSSWAPPPSGFTAPERAWSGTSRVDSGRSGPGSPSFAADSGPPPPAWTPDKAMMKAAAAERIEASDDAQWRAQTFPWSRELRDLNRERFGNAGFRHNQLSIMNASLSGRDVFVLMPTGMKSLFGN